MIKQWLIDTGFGNETINGLGHAEFIKLFAKFSDRVKRVELTLHPSEVLHIKLIHFSHCFHLVRVIKWNNAMTTQPFALDQMLRP
jgi:hypothetical protein